METAMEHGGQGCLKLPGILRVDWPPGSEGGARNAVWVDWSFSLALLPV